ncbi:MAG: hypothetical protein K6G24_04545 [Lachnospiraceae bacterium]|nr:hypothetical protein [Lachnospiraceae bacterium]
MENKNIKIVVIAAAIILFLFVGLGIFLNSGYDDSSVTDQTYTQIDAPSEPVVSLSEISTEQIEAGAVEGSEGFETDEKSESAEGEDSSEPVEPVTADPVETEPAPTASSEVPTTATATPQVDNPVVENTTPPEEIPVPEVAEVVTPEPVAPVVTAPAYRFRNERLLTEHYEKHGIEMGFPNAAAYEAAASAVITNPNSLFKIEAEDGDGVYYLEATNEFVVLSTDGYIRTYFLPSSGKAYFDRQ